jgi:crotonobetainyl-CoA:carnitine CoA-transferase CaiB-like acyl-CoA transferase
MGMLDDIRILDFSHVYFGPYSTMILGDMGADVIHDSQSQGA